MSEARQEWFFFVNQLYKGYGRDFDRQHLYDMWVTWQHKQRYCDWDCECDQCVVALGGLRPLTSPGRDQPSHASAQVWEMLGEVYFEE